MLEGATDSAETVAVDALRACWGLDSTWRQLKHI